MAFRYRFYQLVWMWLVILVFGSVSTSAQSNTTVATNSINSISLPTAPLTSNTVAILSPTPLLLSSVITTASVTPSPWQSSVLSVPPGSNTTPQPSGTIATVGPSQSQAQISPTISPSPTPSASVNQTVSPSPTQCWACKNEACGNTQSSWYVVTILLGMSLLTTLYALV